MVDGMIETKKTHQEILKDIEEQETLIAQVMNGEEVYCKVCGKPLVFKNPGSGVHPGIYCGTGCTEILLDMQPMK